MEALLHNARRRFCTKDHLRNLLEGEWVSLYNEAGEALSGIKGRIGAAGLTERGEEFGADLLRMSPGSGFPIHTHPGDHLLYVLEGFGIVFINGIDVRVETGDSIFIPADYPHAVKTYAEATGDLLIIAVGHPHKALSATDRMHVLTPEEKESWPAGS